MPALDASELAAMQASIAAVNSTTILVLRNQRTRVAGGGSTSVFATVATVLGFIEPAGGDEEQEMAGRVGNISHWYVHLPVGTAVEVGDRLQVGARLIEVFSHDNGRDDQLTIMVEGREVGI